MMQAAIKPFLIDLVGGLAAVILAFFFALKPNSGIQLWFMLVFAGLILRLVINLFSVFFRTLRGTAIRRIGINVCSIILVFLVARIALSDRDMVFKNQIASYNEAVSFFTQNDLASPRSLGLVPIPPQYSKLADHVAVEKRDNGTVTIEFYLGGGFPAAHVGYLYRSDDNIEADDFYKERWPRLHRILPNWYAFGG